MAMNGGGIPGLGHSKPEEKCLYHPTYGVGTRICEEQKIEIEDAIFEAIWEKLKVPLEIITVLGLVALYWAQHPEQVATIIEHFKP